PLLQLGVALKTMGDATRGEEAIVLALKTPRNSDERIWLGDYGSPLRDNALHHPWFSAQRQVAAAVNQKRHLHD
ncbi:hypothetical protein ACUOCP_57665, partial [Escherichia sp. R-CC3]